MPEDPALRQIKRVNLPAEGIGDKKRSSIFRHGQCRRPQPLGSSIGLFSQGLHGRRAAVLPCRSETSCQQDQGEAEECPLHAVSAGPWWGGRFLQGFAGGLVVHGILSKFHPARVQ
jgi:hypothetical protein